MSKRKANGTILDSFAKKKCSSKFKTEWLSELVETELPTSAENRRIKALDWKSISTEFINYGRRRKIGGRNFSVQHYFDARIRTTCSLLHHEGIVSHS